MPDMNISLSHRQWMTHNASLQCILQRSHMHLMILRNNSNTISDSTISPYRYHSISLDLYRAINAAPFPDLKFSTFNLGVFANKYLMPLNVHHAQEEG